MYNTKHSEVGKVVAEQGLTNKGKQPVKIITQ